MNGSASMNGSSSAKHDRNDGYYGRPMIKPPEWTDLIPTYFFTGGLAGACAATAFAERLAKNDRLARTMLLGAAAGAAVSGFCLVADLKRPERFLNMLRVFKPTSPMSMGVYIFSVFGTSALLAAASDVTGIARPLGRVFEGAAALSGPAMSVYTAVLIGDTVVPAWHYGRISMPALFAATSLSTAGAFGMAFTPIQQARTARRLAVVGAAGSIAALQMLHEELGSFQEEAYETGEAAFFSHAARLLNITGAVVALFAKKSDPLAKTAGCLLFFGGLAERFGVFRAGCVSGKDPKYTIHAQRERMENGRATLSALPV